MSGPIGRYEKRKKIHPLDVFEIIAIIDAIPCKWREILKTESIEDKSDFVF